MKSMKGRILKKIKSVKPIGYIKPDQILHVNAADGFLDFIPKFSIIKSQQEKEIPNLVACNEDDKENIIHNSVIVQEPEVIDVEEIMRDLEIELDCDNVDNKENVRQEEEILVKKQESVINSSEQVPLGEIDVSAFRRPDMNSGTLFDPNLLAAFEEAVKVHMKMKEAERKLSIEEKQKEEESLEMNEIERPCKDRRIEEYDKHTLLRFEEKCPPGGDGAVIVYTTSLRGIRKTFEDCNSVRFLLDSFRVLYYERDVSMHMEYREELWRVLGSKCVPPKLFINGRYIGGAEEVLTLHEQGKLRILFDGIPIDESSEPCEGCGGFRFLMCFNCNGSHKIIGDDGLLSSKCQDCNENGLIICSYCC